MSSSPKLFNSIERHSAWVFSIAGRAFCSHNQVENDVALSEGFWRELFLLPADKARLIEILDPLTADDLLHTQVCSASYTVSLSDSVAHPHLGTNATILQKINRINLRPRNRP